MNPLRSIRAACFDWGGTLMPETGGPDDVPMCFWPRVEAIAGAAEALARLRGRLPLAIATNASVSKRPQIQRALDRAGLGQDFGHIFCYTDLGFRKDRTEFWTAVQAGLGVPLGHVAMVGDSYAQDALFPRRFGVQGVWFNAGGAAMRPTAAGIPVVTRLSTFASWVEAALAQ